MTRAPLYSKTGSANTFTALISFGYTNVFPHIGQNVKVRAPNGRDVYPLVTGTFGGADFIHSLMGEATDHLSQVGFRNLVILIFSDSGLTGICFRP